jgi:solute:Na+ symporter, SSS family
MQILGLHILDVLVLILYFAVILWLGKKAGDQNADTNDFFLAGRTLGKFYQFFLNFGAGTNSDQAVAVSREAYRQGVGGIWIQFVVLFLTPFYWFTTLLYRRARLTTIGDFFTERFNSKGLGAGYAVFILFWAFISGGVGYIVAAKTMMAMTPKPAEVLTVDEALAVEEFKTYTELQSLTFQERTAAQQLQYEALYQKNLRGELKSFHSYTNPLAFYLIYGLLVGIYTMMGGFRAAAITDAIQGVLIVVFSFMLIPIGLAKLGGFSGLHASVPEFKFELFGSVAMSDYAWYTILAMACANLASIIAFPTFMQTAGSATNENAARFGMLGGMFLKRFIMLFWVLAGLIALGLFGGQIHDPDLAWGVMSRELLLPGLMGLMLVGILAANMSTLDAVSVSNSALFIRNLYQPWFPNCSEQHYLTIGRVIIAICLLGGIAVAVYVDNLLELFKYFISIPAIFGAPIWLGFVWKRLTKVAVIIEVVVCSLLFAIIPNLFINLHWASHREQWLTQTNGYTVAYKQPATLQDVELQRASVVGETVLKETFIEPRGIFFEKVVRQDPMDPNSAWVGTGRFEAEIWFLSWFGIDFSDWKKSQLVAVRFFFSALFPFFLLFAISMFTRPVDRKVTDFFSAKIFTPVQADPATDSRLVHEYANNPSRWNHRRLFPSGNWNIAKPTRSDAYGFGGSCLIVVFILFCLWAMVNIK